MTELSESRSYEIGHLLGKGGFGTVYKASLIGPGGFQKTVALKILHNDMDGLEEIAQRMRDEARMLGLIRHRAIVHVDGLASLNGQWVVVMEFIDGVDLEAVLQQTRMPPGCVMEVIEEVASALDAAYKTKVGPDDSPLCLLHRDIKPANIQLTPQGETKVLDFGIARAEFEEREAETKDLTFGSLHWMAPERLDLIECHEGDVYSLGVVMFELLAGERFGKAQASPARHEKLLRANIEKLEALEVPGNIRSFLLACVEYEPEERLSAGEVAKRARLLSRETADTPLVEWCEEHIPGVQATDAPATDALFGTLLTENSTDRLAGLDEPEFEREPLLTSEVTRTAAAVAVGGGAVAVGFSALAVAAVVVLGLILGAWFYVSQSSTSSEPIEVAQVEATPQEPVQVIEEVADTDEAVVDVDTDPPEGEDAEADAAVQTARIYSFPPSTKADEACGGLAGLEVRASDGQLSRNHMRCLDTYARDTTQVLTDRRKLGRILIVNNQQSCERTESCTGYERFQPWFFSELDRSDPSMMLQWSIYNHEKGLTEPKRLQDAVTWSERALERKQVWKSVEFVRNVETAHETRARAAYAIWSAAHESDPYGDHKAPRAQAKTATMDWMNYRLHLGKDPAEARQMCESVTGSSEVCAGGSAERAKAIVLTFISAPLGATIFVDGEEAGTAPLVHELRSGKHTVRMVLDDGTESQTKIAVGASEPTRYIWKSTQDTWTPGY